MNHHFESAQKPKQETFLGRLDSALLKIAEKIQGTEAHANALKRKMRENDEDPADLQHELASVNGRIQRAQRDKEFFRGESDSAGASYDTRHRDVRRLYHETQGAEKKDHLDAHLDQQRGYDKAASDARANEKRNAERRTELLQPTTERAIKHYLKINYDLSSTEASLLKARQQRTPRGVAAGNAFSAMNRLKDAVAEAVASGEPLLFAKAGKNWLGKEKPQVLTRAEKNIKSYVEDFGNEMATYENNGFSIHTAKPKY